MSSSLRFGWWTRGRRRQVLVGFQSRYITVQLAWTLVLLLGFAALRLAPPLVGLDSVSAATRLERVTQFLHIHETLWVSLGALAAALTAASISLSHRVAGPLYRFRKVFEAVQQGDLAVSTRLRAGDYLMAEREELEQMLVVLRQHIGTAQRAAEAGRVASDPDELRARLDAVHEALRLFVVEPSPLRPPAVEPVPLRPRLTGKAGLSLVELMVVLALIATTSALAIPHYLGVVETARVTRAIGDIEAIDREIALYAAQHGCLPSSLADIGYADRKDPWGNTYSYQVLGTGPEAGGAGDGGGAGNSGGGGAGADAGGKPGGDKAGKGGNADGNGKGNAAGGDGAATGGGTGGTDGTGGRRTASCAACNGQCVGSGQARKDHNLVPINSDFDLFSSGPDGKSVPALTGGPSRDDIVRGSDGAYFGPAKDY